MASVRTTTVVINGAAAEASQVVAVADKERRYVGLYAKTGACKVSFGEGTHANDYLVISQGNLLELAVNVLDKITFSTTGAVLNVIQDIESKVSLTSDNLILTTDGYNMTYNTRDQSVGGRRTIPVFS